jgi:glycosyltransferase involved in cell wall biosynthesis
MHGPTEFDDVVGYALAEKVRRASFVACIGDYCRSQLMKLVEPGQWDKLEVVRCGLDPADHPPVERAGRDGGPIEVLSVGRLVADKGQGMLVEAMAELARRGVAATATLVGEGPARAALEARVRELGAHELVRLVGAADQDEMARRYAAADVFCLPSFAEGIPVVLMEAMASGLPVVATRVGGVAELVEDGVSGTLVPAGRPGALADAIERLAAEPGLRARWGAEGRERVLAEFDVGVSARRLQRLLADHAGRPEQRSRTAPASIRARNGSPSTR